MWRSAKKAALLLIVCVLIVRLSPYLVPLRANDIPEVAGRLVRFYDREGNFLGSVVTGGDTAAQVVLLSEVSPNVIRAFLAAEDKRFYSHGGVDFIALLRATGQNLKARRVVSGGSTITMQLVRLLYPRPRTLLTKAVEAYTAWRLEAGMTKDHILEAYLNRVPMGGNLAGVGTAAEVYFGIPVKRLNVSQAAFLAAIPQSPTRHDPRMHPQSLESRRRHILRAMQSARPPFGNRARSRENDLESRLSSQVQVTVNREAKTLNAHHCFFYAMRSASRQQTRVRVTLTLDADIQRMVTEQVKQRVQRLKDRHVTNAAAIVVENATGYVLAYVGSASFLDAEHSGCVDGVQALRQPGSALKPFLYAAALERGYTAASILPDVPVTFAGEEPYEPENYSRTFRGPVRLRIALANSLNVPAIQLASRLGASTVLDTLRDFGFASLKESPRYYGLGLVLGGGEVSLYEMARAYMALAKGGVFADLRVFTREEGDALAEPPNTANQMYDREAAWLVTDILSDHRARAMEFGQDSVLNLPFPCAVKTGTSSRFRDSWAVGYTTKHTVAVWVGNFDGSPMDEVAGIAGAGPLFARIMMNLYRSRSFPEPFPRPAAFVRRPVCSLSGMRPNPSCACIAQEWFTRSRVEDYSSHPCTWHREEVIDVRTGSPCSLSCPIRFRKSRVRTIIPAQFQVR